MPEYDVRDQQGRKIGTIETSHGSYVGLFVILVVVAVVAVIVSIPAMLISWVGSSLHPAMPRSYFPAKDANIRGNTQRSSDGATVRLHPGASIRFTIDNKYSEGRFLITPEFTFHGYYYSVDAYANTSRILYRDLKYLGADLKKQINTIELVNSGKYDIDFDGLYVEDKLCEGGFSSFLYCSLRR